MRRFICSLKQVGTWPRGKALGGTSNLNYMLYVRCHPKDYDNWANITGDPTWRYENVLPFFKKSLDYHGDYASNRNDKLSRLKALKLTGKTFE